ncbi:MAG: alpha/beta hydrolase family protein, partial [Acidimicrobiales bacterium]
LWVAELVSGGASGAGAGGGAGAPGLRDPRLVAGGPEESVFQPEWAPDRLLYYVTDAGRPGARRWRLARQDLDRGSREEGVDGTSPFASVGRPQWVFGLSTYALLPDGRPVVCWSEEGMDHLGVVSGASRAGGAGGAGGELDVPYTAVSHVVATGRGVLFLGAGPRTAREVVELAVGPGSGGAGGGAWPRTVGEPVVLARSRPVQLEPADLSEPEPVEFPTSDGRTAHALYYPPTSSRLRGPEHERPPLIVMSHGGPTSATSSALDLTVQYWTSRGIAVVDVDYGGSTGYGRAYRERLQGMWGIVDVDDCVNAALHLVERGDVDRERLAIRGGSAGGYTTLCALTFRDLFTAGASYYGVADAAALAADTHKFESHYTDGLIGPWPEAADLYRERSPLFHTDLLSCPLIVFQGLDDPVVPPNQAEALVAALAERGIPHAYLAFDGEQHGFRRAETVRRCLEAELSFYAAVLHFDLADPIEPVVIEGLPPA